MLGTPAVVFIIGLCLLCFFLVFFPGSVCVWIFAWLCEWASDNALTAGCAVTLSSGVLFIKPTKKLQNNNLAELFGFSAEATLRAAVLPDKGLQAKISAQEAAAALPCPGART